jgi:hypothetical protein
LALIAPHVICACSTRPTDGPPAALLDSGVSDAAPVALSDSASLDANDDAKTAPDGSVDAGLLQSLVVTYVFHGGLPETLTMTYDKNLVYPGANEIYTSTGTASNGATTALLQVTVNTTQPANPVIDAKMNFPFMKNGYYVLRCIDGKSMMDCVDAQFKVDRVAKTIDFVDVKLVGENLSAGQLSYDLEQLVTFSGRIQYGR